MTTTDLSLGVEPASSPRRGIWWQPEYKTLVPPSDIEHLAEIGYLAFHSDGYSPSWRTAGDKTRWRRAIQAVLEASHA